MKTTSLSVRLDSTTLTGDELQRMAVGILNHQGILQNGEWPEFTTYFDIIPNPEDACLPLWVIRMCESAEDEKKAESFAQLVGENDYGFDKGSILHFVLKRKPKFKRDIIWSERKGCLAEVLVSLERNQEIEAFISAMVSDGKSATLQEIVNALNERGDLNDNEWTAVMFNLGHWNARQGY